MRPTYRTLDAVVDAIAAAAVPGSRIVVGIAGAPGAGKSTVAAALVSGFGPDAALLPMDGFHLPQRTLIERGARERMGAPDTFDLAAFVAALEDVRAATAEIRAPGFDRTIEEPIPDAVVIPAAARIIVVEGNYLLHDAGGWERVAPLLDLALLVEVPQDLRLERLIARHVQFGKSPAGARTWASGPDESNARLIARGAPRADGVIALDGDQTPPPPPPPPPPPAEPPPVDPPELDDDAALADSVLMPEAKAAALKPELPAYHPGVSPP